MAAAQCEQSAKEVPGELSTQMILGGAAKQAHKLADAMKELKEQAR